LHNKISNNKIKILPVDVITESMIDAKVLFQNPAYCIVCSFCLARGGVTTVLCCGKDGCGGVALLALGSTIFDEGSSCLLSHSPQYLHLIALS